MPTGNSPRKIIWVGHGATLPRTSMEVERVGTVAEARANRATPWLFVIEERGPGQSAEFDEVKRDPRLHFVPVASIAVSPSAAPDRPTVLRPFARLQNPVGESEWKALIDRRDAQVLRVAELRALDEALADNALEQIDELRALANPLSAQTLPELLRAFHTLKGTADTLQFPHWGAVMHDAETVLSLVRAHRLYHDARVTPWLLAVIEFVAAQAQAIQDHALLPLPSPAILGELRASIEHSSSKPFAGPHAIAAPQVKARRSPPEHRPNRRHPTRVRVSRVEITRAQARFKKLTQLRTRMNQFARRLQLEFSDESFPRELLTMIDDLGSLAAGGFAQLTGWQRVPVARLRATAARAVQAAAEHLGKEVACELGAEATGEIDADTAAAIEDALIHLARNSVSHGIETALERARARKPARGTVSIDFARIVDPDGQAQLRVEVADDGRGIDPERLKQAVRQHGILSEAALAALTPERALELVFVDGLSTQSEVTVVAGRGIGLGAVRARLRKLGGDVRVRSEPGRGACFELWLPWAGTFPSED